MQFYSCKLQRESSSGPAFKNLLFVDARRNESQKSRQSDPASFFTGKKTRPHHVVFALQCGLIRNEGGFEFQDPVHAGPDFAGMVRVLQGSQAWINPEVFL